jgi:uncharacterized CHY-type Zn-finger protein
MTKSPEMEKFLNSFTKVAFNRMRTTSIQNKICVCCGENVGGFTDALSAKEYGISGMCQKCQDKVFDSE